jgi:hypothetical protein
VEGGIASPKGDAGTRAMIGAALGKRLASATAEMPLDMMLTAGFYPSFGGGFTLLRVPIGLTFGHRFQLEGNAAITPYAHPRVSLDLCNKECFGGGGSDVAIDLDVGGDLELGRQLSLRFAFLFPGGDLRADNAFGLAISYKPSAERP